MGGIDEIGFEMETPPISSVTKGVAGVVGDIFSLVSGDIAGKTEIPKPFEDTFKNDPENSLDPSAGKFPSQGTIEFNKAVAQIQENQKKKEEAQAKRIFYQAYKEDQQRAREAKDKLLFEEEINDIVTNLPTDQKNELLHYQASYKDRSIYQRAELRKKLIEQRKQADKKQREASIAQTQPRATAMQTAFEGASGSQGAGQANLSFQAAG